MNKLILATMTGCAVAAYLLYNHVRLASYTPHPYRSTIYVEPSNITTKLQRDGKRGLACGLGYIAAYRNPAEDDIANLCHVRLLALKSVANRLEGEFYFNKAGGY